MNKIIAAWRRMQLNVFYRDAERTANYCSCSDQMTEECVVHPSLAIW